MLDIISNGLKCNFCGEGVIYLSQPDTVNDYSIPEALRSTTGSDEVIFDEIIDRYFTQHIVFKCNVCQALEKLTYREIEKRVRDKLYQYAIMKMAYEGFRSIEAVSFVDKTFIYCGKCTGFNGKGACPIKVYENCKLKRLPYEL